MDKNERMVFQTIMAEHEYFMGFDPAIDDNPSYSCSAPGCGFLYGYGAPPSPLDVRNHQLDTLIKAGFKFELRLS